MSDQSIIPENEIRRIVEATRSAEAYTRSVDNLSRSKKKLSSENNNLVKLLESYEDHLEKLSKEEKMYAAAAHLATAKRSTVSKTVRKEKEEALKIMKDMTQEEKRQTRQWASVGKKRLTPILKGVSDIKDRLQKAFGTKGIEDYKAALKDALTGGDIDKVFKVFGRNLAISTRGVVEGLGFSGIPFDEKTMSRDLIRMLADSKVSDAYEDELTEASDRAMDDLVDQFKKAGTEMKRHNILKKVLDEDEVKKAIDRMKTQGSGAVVAPVVGRAASSLGMKGIGSGIQGGANLAKGFSGISKEMDIIARASKQSGESLGLVSKGLGGLSTALSALGKMSWLFALVGALGALAKTVSNLDKYAKGLNQEFLRMAGPTVGFRDITESMKIFKKEIHDFDRDTRLGLRAGEIQKMFGAASAAGLSYQGMGQRIGDTATMIEKSRKLSLEFGVSFEEMGGMIAQQSLEMNSGLDAMQKSFDKVAYSASLAGISSNKFYQIVQANTLSMGFYNKQLEESSSILRKITEVGAVSFEGAQELTKELSTGFGGKTTSELRETVAFLEGIGDGQIFNEMLKENIDAITKEIGDITKRIKGTRDSEERERLFKQKYAMEGRRERFTTAQRTGDLSQKGAALGEMGARDQTRAIFEVLDELGTSFGEASTGIIDLMVNRGLISDKGYRQMENTVMSITARLGKFDKIFSSDLRNLNDIAKKELQGAIEEISSEGLGIKDATEKIRAILPKEAKKDAEQIAMAVRDHAGFVSGIVAGTGITTEQYTQQYLEGGEVDPMRRAGGIEDLIKKITPMEKYLEIGKDALKMGMSDSDLLATISMATRKAALILGQIFTWLNLGKDPAKKQKDKFQSGIEKEYKDALRAMYYFKHTGQGTGEDFKEAQERVKKIEADNALIGEYVQEVRGKEFERWMRTAKDIKSASSLGKEELEAQTVSSVSSQSMDDPSPYAPSADSSYAIMTPEARKLLFGNSQSQGGNTYNQTNHIEVSDTASAQQVADIIKGNTKQLIDSSEVQSQTKD